MNDLRPGDIRTFKIHGKKGSEDLSGNETPVEHGQKKIINSFTQTNALYLLYLNFFNK